MIVRRIVRMFTSRDIYNISGYQPFAQRTRGPSIGGSIEPGRQISSCFKPIELGLELIPDAAGQSHDGNKKHGGQPTEFGMEPKRDGRDSYCSIRDAPSLRFPVLSAGPFDKELGNQIGTLNGEKLGLVNSQSMMGVSSRGEAIGFMHEVNSHHLGRALPQPMADGESPSIGGNIEQGGLLSDCFKLNVSKGSSSTQAFCSVQGLGSLPQAMADGEGPAEKSSKKLAPFFFPKQVAALFKK